MADFKFAYVWLVEFFRTFLFAEGRLFYLTYGK